VNKREGEVLVEEIPEEFAHSIIGPSSVNKQQSLKKPELGNRVVGSQNGLHALLPADTNTYMCS